MASFNAKTYADRLEERQRDTGAAPGSAPAPGSATGGKFNVGTYTGKLEARAEFKRKYPDGNGIPRIPTADDYEPVPLFGAATGVFIGGRRFAVEPKRLKPTAPIGGAEPGTWAGSATDSARLGGGDLAQVYANALAPDTRTPMERAKGAEQSAAAKKAEAFEKKEEAKRVMEQIETGRSRPGLGAVPQLAGARSEYYRLLREYNEASAAHTAAENEVYRLGRSQSNEARIDENEKFAHVNFETSDTMGYKPKGSIYEYIGKTPGVYTPIGANAFGALDPYANAALSANAEQTSQDIRVANMMTDSEQNTYLYYMESGQTAKGREYYNYLKPALERRLALAVAETSREYGREHPVLGTIGSLALGGTMLNPFGFNGTTLGTIAGQAMRGEWNPYDPGLGYGIAQSGLQGGAAERAGESGGAAGEFLYGTGYSILQNLANLPMGELGTLASFGLSAAGSDSLMKLREGNSAGTSLLSGAVRGAIEVLTEKISLDKLFEVWRGGGRTFVRSMLAQMIPEMTEEGVAEVLGAISDSVLLGRAIDVRPQDVLLAMLGGAFSGGVMGLPGAIRSQSQLNAENAALGSQGLAVSGAAGLAASDAADNVTMEEYVDRSVAKSRFVENPVIDSTPVKPFVIGEVSDELVDKVRREYGADLSGRVHVAADNDLRHIYNSHGPHTNEKYPVTAADLKLIPDIIAAPDDVYYVTHNDGKTGLYYRKRYNGTTFFVENDNVGGELWAKQIIKVGSGTLPNVPALQAAVMAKEMNRNPTGPREYVQDGYPDAAVGSDSIAPILTQSGGVVNTQNAESEKKFYENQSGVRGAVPSNRSSGGGAEGRDSGGGRGGAERYADALRRFRAQSREQQRRLTGLYYRVADIIESLRVGDELGFSDEPTVSAYRVVGRDEYGVSVNSIAGLDDYYIVRGFATPEDALMLRSIESGELVVTAQDAGFRSEALGDEGDARDAGFRSEALVDEGDAQDAGLGSEALGDEGAAYEREYTRSDVPGSPVERYRFQRGRGVGGLIRDANLTEARKRGLTGEQERQLDLLGRVAARTVRFTSELRRGANAAYDSGEILISVDAADPVTWAALHEVVHSVAESDPAVYRELERIVLETVDSGRLETSRYARRELYRQARPADGQAVDERSDASSPDDTYIDEEIVADALADMMYDAKLLERLEVRGEGVLARLARAVRHLLRRLGEAWSSRSRGGLGGVGLTKFRYEEFAELRERLAELEAVFADALDRQRDAQAAGGESRYSFAGKGSRTADTVARSSAESMERKGRDSEEIRRDTGWFRGMDSKWRYELDEKLTVKTAVWERLKSDNGITVALSELVDSAPLFEAYPELAGIRVNADALNGENASLWGSGSTLHISLNNTLGIDSVAEALVHEIQHVIQDEEGFTPGTSIRSSEGRFVSPSAETVRAAEQQLNDIEDKFASNDRARRALLRCRDAYAGERFAIEYDLPEADAEEFALQSDDAYKELSGAVGSETAMKYWRALADKSARYVSPHDVYYNTAGEIEARDAGARRGMSAEERRSTRPDLQKDGVFFADGSGRSEFSKYKSGASTLGGYYDEALANRND
ncbi:MAG: hypothetical protein LBC65_05450, partial [Oscillospiraceae bacterium]|nr:hypothetical protein [Oscillospiraceae bacterium]